jgi:hypothetical protein
MTAEPRIEWGTRSGGLQAAAHLEEAGSRKPAAHSRHVGGRARQRLRAAGMQLLAQLQLQRPAAKLPWPLLAEPIANFDNCFALCSLLALALPHALDTRLTTHYSATHTHDLTHPHPMAQPWHMAHGTTQHQHQCQRSFSD